jgi:gamma-glutamylcyclotransferase (GGCT)/AIG2-like uncharacterized protein YtfP
VFVYGTLKRGCENHDMFCAGALSIKPATVLGRLFAHPAGFPLLKVPEHAVLAVGTTDPLHDARTQEAFRRKPLQSGTETGPRAPREFHWRRIRGELITFDDPTVRLPALDELEDFHPGQPSLYLRVLVAAQLEQHRSTPAWTYVAAIPVQDLVPMPQDHWSC